MPTSSLMPIKACLFDMDGLLINSENLLTTCINRILQAYSAPLYPWSVKAQLQGWTAVEGDEILLAWAKLPISRSEYRRQFREHQEEQFPSAQFLPGATELLSRLRRERQVEMSLATSSLTEPFNMKTGHLRDVFDTTFHSNLRVLGDNPNLKRHKPEPDCYLLALQYINAKRHDEGKPSIANEECLVFEDAMPVVLAGQKAEMQVIWCPHRGLLDELQHGVDGAARRILGDLFDL